MPTNSTANPPPLCAKNKAWLRRIRFQQVTCAYQRSVWNGLVRVSIGRGGRPVDQFDQYSKLSENTLHSTWGRHTNTHRQMWVTDIDSNRFASVNCRFMFTGYLKVQRLQHTPNTHTHTSSSFNSISCQVFSSSVAFLLLFLLAFVFVLLSGFPFS